MNAAVLCYLKAEQHCMDLLSAPLESWNCTAYLAATGNKSVDKVSCGVLGMYESHVFFFDFIVKLSLDL
jgi:hypothetical protein